MQRRSTTFRLLAEDATVSISRVFAPRSFSSKYRIVIYFEIFTEKGIIAFRWLRRLSSKYLNDSRFMIVVWRWGNSTIPPKTACRSGSNALTCFPSIFFFRFSEKNLPIFSDALGLVIAAVLLWFHCALKKHWNIFRKRQINVSSTRWQPITAIWMTPKQIAEC